MKSSCAAVAGGHAGTVDAACEVLKSGGNAFDAAVAAMAAACVVEPVLASLGGGGFLLASPADGRSRLYDFFVQAPGRRPENPDALDIRPIEVHFGTETQMFRVGWGTAAVPGLIAGLFEVHRDLGRMPTLELFEAAIDFARSGIEVDATTEHQIDLVQAVYLSNPDGAALFASAREKGSLVREGERLCQPDLADFLDSLAREGPALFYRGEAGGALLRESGEGGSLTRSDLENYRVETRRPLEVPFAGVRVETNPPPASGGILVAFGLGLLDDGDRRGDVGEGEMATRMARVIDATGAARIECLEAAGPGEADDSLDRLLAPELIHAWRERVRPLAPASRGTTHISIADGEGSVASMTISNGTSSGCVIPGTGVTINNMLGETDLNPRGLHSWSPGQRLTSMMAPTLVHWPDGRRVATGSGGSNRIRSAVLQVVNNLVARKMSVEAAVCESRLHVEEGRLSVEGGYAPSARDALCDAWPDHRLWGDRSMFFGGAHTVAIAAGRAEGVGDPRRGGIARTL